MTKVAWIGCLSTNKKGKEVMKVYGFRIGSIGIEYADQQTREKAMLAFTNGHCTEIREYGGPRFEDGRGDFSVYERDNTDQIMNCHVCSGHFSSESCSQKSVPKKSYNGKFLTDQTEDIYLCAACALKRRNDYQEFLERESEKNESPPEPAE